MVFSLENDQLLYLVKEMPHSEVMHTKQYEDKNIVLYTYQIKNSDRATVIVFFVNICPPLLFLFAGNSQLLALHDSTTPLYPILLHVSVLNYQHIPGKFNRYSISRAILPT